MMFRVLIIGESCVDKFVYGEANRLSPEAPIPVFVPKYVKKNMGMASNVMSNLRKITHESDYQIDIITQDAEITKTRYVDDKSNHPFLRVDDGEDKVERIFLTEDVIDELKTYNLVIVSDYDKGFLSEEDLKIISNNSRISVLDTKKKLSDDIMKNHFSFIKLNEIEFNRNFTNDIKILDKLIITLGSKGAKYKDKLFPSESPRETIDVSGAGDTFTSSFISKYFQTKDVEQSIIFANEMSSIVVSKRGVSTP